MGRRQVHSAHRNGSGQCDRRAANFLTLAGRWQRLSKSHCAHHSKCGASATAQRLRARSATMRPARLWRAKCTRRWLCVRTLARAGRCTGAQRPTDVGTAQWELCAQPRANCAMRSHWRANCAAQSRDLVHCGAAASTVAPVGNSCVGCVRFPQCAGVHLLANQTIITRVSVVCAREND